MLPADHYPNQRWFEWARAFEGLRADLVDLGVKRTIHKAHKATIANRMIADGTGIVHRWLQDNYADSMLIGLRRILDRTRGSVSLVKVLEALRREHSTITLERFLVLCRAKEGGADNDFFWRMVYGQFSAGTSLDQKRITSDIEELEGDHQAVLEFTNSVVAHRRQRDPFAREENPAPAVTWENLDNLFEGVCTLFNRYYALVNPGVHVDFNSVLPAGFDQAFVRMLRSDRDGEPVV